jgi:hypothetical protein
VRTQYAGLLVVGRDGLVLPLSSNSA